MTEENQSGPAPPSPIPSAPAPATIVPLPAEANAESSAVSAKDLRVPPTPAVPTDAPSAKPSEPIKRPPQLTAAQQRAAAAAQKKKSILDGISGFATSAKYGKSYAVVTDKGYPEPLAIGGQDLNARIRSLVRKTGESIKQRELEELNEELRSQAEEVGVDVDIFPRVHPLEVGVEIDLCDGAGTTVRIEPGKVEVLHGTSSTLFQRTGTAMALPIPADRGDAKLMRKFVNLPHESFYLYLAWLTFTIAHPKVESTKYVFLVLKGTQGSGKSFVSKCSQKLIDPRTIGAQTLPNNERELAIILQSTHLMVVDNVREISPALSDILCIASTGGGVATRKLYTDDEQKSLHLHGQLLFNGIHPFMGQSDFADRCLVFDLPPLPKEQRKFESEMLAEFEADKPVILRGLYDLVAATLQCLPHAKVSAPARMLDFSKWLSATELATGVPEGSLQDLYVDMLRDAQLESLMDNPLAVTIIEFVESMKTDETWTGTPTDFYHELDRIAGFSSQRSRAWPSSAAVMSKRLHGLQAPLAAQGVIVELGRGKHREISVTKADSFVDSKAPRVTDEHPDGGSESAY